jgi:hypothetical protein
VKDHIVIAILDRNRVGDLQGRRAGRNEVI